MVVTSEALVNVCEQLVQGRTRQCSGWNWTRDLQSYALTTIRHRVTWRM